ncbi:single-stranded DNA-binding protein [Campylobacter jejuni]|nr:single-stranded DNA-binding protein [Campylobacter jejuni]ECX4029041.1 single-stranded DNA-binding protein [Campylobacter coli]EAL3384817.1 single-stranded DNA-binding protein [Campylobacter jejuni]EDO6569122.1 single-stranded DNA-binding protein [Campylobacter coli]EFO5205662.1 single-stranded DNA-binding protein [Campylobacter coli]
MFNQITVIGNICQDIELNRSQSGVSFINNAIASSYKYTANDGTVKEEVCYLSFSVFGKLAENMNRYLHKGSKIFLQGRMVQENYIDQEGKNRTKYKIAVEAMKFLDSKPADNNQSGKNVQETSTPEASEPVQQAPEASEPTQQGENFPF